MGSRFVMVPGIGGSGPEHWQSHWQDLAPGATRIAPGSWKEPELADWIAALERVVAAHPQPPVLVCHSLGCLLFAHWCAVSSGAIAAAFLVAVPDPLGPIFPARAREFGALPASGFGDRPVLAVASEDDPYDPEARAIAWAAGQGARPRLLGRRGHLNGASGLGAWPEGQALLAEFLDEIGGIGEDTPRTLPRRIAARRRHVCGRNWYIGIYHYMSARHLHRYVNEFSFCHNTARVGTMDFIGTTIDPSFDEVLGKIVASEETFTQGPGKGNKEVADPGLPQAQ